MNPANATECLDALREAIFPIKAIQEQIEKAHADEAALAQKASGLHGQQREDEEAASSPTRLRLCQQAISLEDSAIDHKEVLAAAIKQAAVHAADLLVPAIEAKLTTIVMMMLPFSGTLERATEAAKRTEVYRTAQQVVDGLRDQNQIYHRGIPMNRLLKQARLIEAILSQASMERPDFSQILAPAPGTAR